MDEPAFPGCFLHWRLIGIIEGEQKAVHNFRLGVVERAAMDARVASI